MLNQELKATVLFLDHYFITNSFSTFTGSCYNLETTELNVTVTKINVRNIATFRSI